MSPCVVCSCPLGTRGFPPRLVRRFRGLRELRGVIRRQVELLRLDVWFIKGDYLGSVQRGGAATIGRSHVQPLAVRAADACDDQGEAGASVEFGEALTSPQYKWPRRKVEQRGGSHQVPCVLA